MSVNIPRVVAAFGGYGLTESDIIECRVHLGCTKEVSSFELLLQNWNGKYSPSGSVPLAVGMEGYVKVGRISSPPQLISGRIESLKYFGKPTENYVYVSGRCYGEFLFRRVFTGTFENQKGEDIVKYLLDNLVGLSHNRDGTELVEATDTTYTKLEFDNTPVFDIIKQIADTADKNGVIGYDFRVAPDGKFEFFPRGSKTSNVSLSEVIEEYEFRRDISRVRNKIYIYGCEGKKLPTDDNEDGYTESTTNWESNGTVTLTTTHVTEDGEKKYSDSYAVQAFLTTCSGDLYLRRVITGLKFKGREGFKKLRFWLRWNYDSGNTPTAAKLRLYRLTSDYFETDILGLIGAKGEYKKINIDVDKATWTQTGSPLWSNINYVGVVLTFSSAMNVTIAIDHLVMEDCRFYDMQQSTTSQQQYGLRELTDTDEELKSDTECYYRARALLDYYKNPSEHLTVKTTVLNYDITPILAGDKITVTLPNEGINTDYRVESAEYHVDAKTQTLTVTLELGKETPLLADYIYALKAKTQSLSRLKAGGAVGFG